MNSWRHRKAIARIPGPTIGLGTPVNGSHPDVAALPDELSQAPQNPVEVAGGILRMQHMLSSCSWRRR